MTGRILRDQRPAPRIVREHTHGEVAPAVVTSRRQVTLGDVVAVLVLAAGLVSMVCSIGGGC